ncbi:GPP34 family phosphoprotein [Streptomyces sp. RerS4]|uniref:GOLPH3/VPS74 family protein n=1 Tax=Streptomyces sp. RerS4 TaxID=2942449 RepID=UPI00201C4BAC|nr:GPP34 family phosphoprotein [Streptomyces sp. RerS4]UQX05225.1 GPP34 family phosphoprotein [Streptomyces sp. RerS4]
MNNVTLAEEVMLLSLDDESGSARKRQAAGWAVAGGILLELVLAGRVTVTGKQLELTDTTPTGDALLDERLALIGTWLRQRPKRPVTGWLTKDHTRAVAATLRSLSARGVVVETRDKALGLFPVRRYPEADASVERALRERLRAAVLDGSEPDARTAGLIALLHSAKLHRLAFPDGPHGEVKSRMAEISQGQWAADHLRAAIREMQAAVTVLTTVTVMTAIS